MNSKILILSVAVIAVGLFALPSTLSLFSGQHTWYKVDDIKCQKCHQDIYDELTTRSAYHGKWEATYSNACAGCHTTGLTNTTLNKGKTGANLTTQQWIAYKRSSTTITGSVGFTAHAAITVECLACHGTSTPSAGNNSPLNLMSNTEAHRNFYYAAVSNKAVGDVNYSSLKNAGIITGAPEWYDTSKPNQTVIQLKGSNTACIGCHTHAVVNITWKRSVGYGMNVDSTQGFMNVTSWSVNQTTTTTLTSSE